MKIKLDENIGRRGIELLRDAGHEVATVTEQGLSGASDQRLFEVCAGEGRVLITLDHDFGQVLRFPPEQSAGLVLLQAGTRLSLNVLLALLRDFLAASRNQTPVGALWIVEPGRLRIHVGRDSES